MPSPTFRIPGSDLGVQRKRAPEGEHRLQPGVECLGHVLEGNSSLQSLVVARTITFSTRVLYNTYYVRCITISKWHTFVGTISERVHCMETYRAGEAKVAFAERRHD